MLEAFNIEALANFAQAHLAIHVGEMHFSPLATCILVLSVAVASLSALNLRRIGKSEDRRKRLLDTIHRTPFHLAEPAQTSRPPWHQRLGAVVAATKIIGMAEQKRLLTALIAAGIKGHGHLATLLAAKVCGGVVFIPLGWVLLEWRQFFVGAAITRFAFLAGAFIVGWRCPDVVLSRLAARRRAHLESGMPDGLDLLVICAAAGLSLDHAIEQVGRVLRSSSREVAKEFAATAAEMRVLPDRSQALENLAQRTGLASLRSIVSTLNQSIKFGTPLAASLQTLAAEMRSERLARFEERAARLPVLLTLPLMAFILPSLMIVIGTPLALRIVDMLGRGP